MVTQERVASSWRRQDSHEKAWHVHYPGKVAPALKDMQPSKTCRLHVFANQ